MDENSEASQPTSAREDSMDGLEEAMERIRISPLRDFPISAIIVVEIANHSSLQ